jgi:hypothetical protein
MKKFIPFLSIMIGSVLSQSCVQRDEDIISTNNEKFEIKTNLQMRYDSENSTTNNRS